MPISVWNEDAPRRLANQRVFTTGYTGKDINDLKPMLEALEAMLVDIRFAPYSRVFHWRKVYLKSLLGEKYRHIPNLGNRTYKEDRITVQNLKLGVETILSLPSNIVLMCACEKTENCHRRLIVEELEQREIRTEEISNWKTRDVSSQNRLF
jgi:uncharacterized protein (DUF488 family)